MTISSSEPATTPEPPREAEPGPAQNVVRLRPRQAPQPPDRPEPPDDDNDPGPAAA